MNGPTSGHAAYFRLGEVQLLVRCAGTPTATTADRRCPTADEHPFEVVSTAGVEALLVRGDRLLAAERASA